MSGYLWKATVRNVNRALKEVNAFEWEGDYRPEAAKRLRDILEERMDEELEQYLGRGKHQRREEGDREDYRNGSYLPAWNPLLWKGRVAVCQPQRRVSLTLIRLQLETC